MKTTNLIVSVMAAVTLLLNANVMAQDEVKEPKYYTVATAHWNMEYEDFDMDTWKAVEKEYLEKVIMKNEHIMGASVYLHHTTPDNTEILFVQVFDSWDAIEKASDHNGELAKEAWPEKENREAFFKKQNAYYANGHSDEIYSVLPGAKLMETPPDKDMIVYLRKSHFAFPEDGSREEFIELRKGYVENVINKNELIKAYYPSTHYYGADGTENIEAFFFDSLSDFDKMFDRNTELVKEAWPDDEARKERGKKVGKYFTGVHGDFIYTQVHELTK
jgi:hypothetical protein